MRPSEIAIRRARTTEDLGTRELPTPIAERPFDAVTITRVEFSEAALDSSVPRRSRVVCLRALEKGNTAEVMRILAIGKNGVYGIESLPYKMVDDHRVYDLDAVREYAKQNRMKSGHVRLHEAATILGCPDAYVSRWARSGELPSVEVNGRRAFRIADLTTFAETHNVSPVDTVIAHTDPVSAGAVSTGTSSEDES